MKHLLATSALIGAMLFGVPAQAGEIRALLSGIDAYPGPERFRLEGAVNDANSLGQTLRTAGVRDVVILTDGAVTKSGLIEAWRGLVARSQPGDVLIFHFSGHGMQIPARDPNDEPDDPPDNKRDEAWVMVTGNGESARVGAGGISDADLLIDNEIHQLIGAVPADRTVILIADSCHSGTTSRSADPRTKPGKSRSGFLGASYVAPASDTGSLSGSFAQSSERQANLIAMYSTRADLAIAEIKLDDGTPHGAMSVAVAEALGGLADGNGDGILSYRELQVYISNRTTTLAAASQIPTVDVPDRLLSASLPRIPLSLRGNASAQPVGTARVFVQPAARAELLGGVDGAVAVSDRAQATYVWDVEKGEVLQSTSGDIISQHITTKAGFIDVLQKQKSVNVLNQLAATTTPALFICKPGSAPAYPEGSRVGLRAVHNPAKPFLTVFNLANDGTVQALFPNTARMNPIEHERQWFDWIIDELAVRAPFGVDNVYAIAAAEAPVKLRDTLSLANGRKEFGSLLSIIQATPDLEISQVRLTTVATGPMPASPDCGQRP
jgi:Caspase domain